MTIKEFWKGASNEFLAQPDWRYGQTLFNYLLQHRPELAEKIRSTEFDPFYKTTSDLGPFAIWLDYNWDK